MKAWLARLFGGAPRASAAPPARTAQTAPAAAPPLHAGAGTSEEADIDVLFFRWLAGDASPQPQPQAQAHADMAILDALQHLAASPDAGASLVPRVPAVIPQLLRSLRDDSVTGAELARQIAQDVVLVAEVIREANSPYYRPAAPIKTIEGAVMLLGQNGMRMLLARVAFRPIISQQSGPFARQLAPAVWRQSELCALAASLLAPRIGAHAFEAYLAGLMENVGLMVALRAIDGVYADAALPRSERFIHALGGHARAMSARIATLWDFPVSVSSAIRCAGAAAADPLARTLALSDRTAKLRLLVDGGKLSAQAAMAALPEPARACFDQLHREDD